MNAYEVEGCTVEQFTKDELKNPKDYKTVKVILKLEDAFGATVIEVCAGSHPMSRLVCNWKYQGKTYSAYCDYDTKLKPGYYFAKDIWYVEISYYGNEPYRVLIESNDNPQQINWL